MKISVCGYLALLGIAFSLHKGASSVFELVVPFLVICQEDAVYSPTTAP